MACLPFIRLGKQPKCTLVPAQFAVRSNQISLGSFFLIFSAQYTDKSVRERILGTWEPLAAACTLLDLFSAPEPGYLGSKGTLPVSQPMPLLPHPHSEPSDFAVRSHLEGH